MRNISSWCGVRKRRTRSALRRQWSCVLGVLCGSDSDEGVNGFVFEEAPGWGSRSIADLRGEARAGHLVQCQMLGASDVQAQTSRSNGRASLGDFHLETVREANRPESKLANGSIRAPGHWIRATGPRTAAIDIRRGALQQEGWIRSNSQVGCAPRERSTRRRVMAMTHDATTPRRRRAITTPHIRPGGGMSVVFKELRAP